MAQQLRSPAAPSVHMVLVTVCGDQFQEIQQPIMASLGTICIWYTDRAIHRKFKKRFHKLKTIGVGDKALGLRTFAALVEDFFLVLSTYMVAHSHLQLQFQGNRCPLLLSRCTNEVFMYIHTYMQAKHSYIKNQNVIGTSDK